MQGDGIGLVTGFLNCHHIKAHLPKEQKGEINKRKRMISVNDREKMVNLDHV
jgi:hypothetical protein